MREGGAKKVSATHDEMLISCERGVSFYCDAAEILDRQRARLRVLRQRLPGSRRPRPAPHTEDVQKVREEFVHIVNVLYSGNGVIGDDTVCNPNRLCPAAGTLKRKGYNDSKLGRLHRLTGIYCSETVELQRDRAAGPARRRGDRGRQFDDTYLAGGYL